MILSIFFFVVVQEERYGCFVTFVRNFVVSKIPKIRTSNLEPTKSKYRTKNLDVYDLTSFTSFTSLKRLLQSTYANEYCCCAGTLPDRRIQVM